MEPEARPPEYDSELLRKARENVPGAFEALIEPVSDRLHRLVRARLGQGLGRRVSVEDVVQETYVRALRDLERFEDRGEDSFLRWLGGIAHHVLLEWARKHRREVILPGEDSLVQSGVTASRAEARHERFGRLETALEQLAPDHRRVILLARIERLPLREVARRMERTPEAVSQLLWRALKKLREQFGSTDSFHLPDRSLTHDEGPSAAPED